MKSFKFMVFGLAIGVLIGLWLGVNIGKGQPLLSNPFAEHPVTEKTREAMEKGKEMYEEGKRIINR